MGMFSSSSAARSPLRFIDALGQYDERVFVEDHVRADTGLRGWRRGSGLYERPRCRRPHGESGMGRDAAAPQVIKKERPGNGSVSNRS